MGIDGETSKKLERFENVTGGNREDFRKEDMNVVTKDENQEEN
jgi:hypothetical protein